MCLPLRLQGETWVSARVTQARTKLSSSVIKQGVAVPVLKARPTKLLPPNSSLKAYLFGEWGKARWSVARGVMADVRGEAVLLPWTGAFPDRGLERSRS